MVWGGGMGQRTTPKTASWQIIGGFSLHFSGKGNPRIYLISGSPTFFPRRSVEGKRKYVILPSDGTRPTIQTMAGRFRKFDGAPKIVHRDMAGGDAWVPRVKGRGFFRWMVGGAILDFPQTGFQRVALGFPPPIIGQEFFPLLKFRRVG